MRAFFFFFYYKIGTPCNSEASGKISNTKKKEKKEKKERRFLDLVYLSTNSLDPRENSNGYLWLF